MSDQSDSPTGIDRAGVTNWFEQHAPDVAAPLEFDLIAGGHSNLTFAVTDSKGSKWVLRRPPLKQVLSTAHDMGREYRVISALAPTKVPVPPVVGLCADDSVNGAPFYVMDYVEGRVVRDLGQAQALTEQQRRRAGESIVDVLAAIHAVDIDEVNLDDFAKRDDYIARQLKRWHGQFEKSATRDVPIVGEVYESLLASIPQQGKATIVHGDYRLDNCMLGDDGSIAAVLDWEICTLGDPLADVGLLLVYWGDPDNEATRNLPAPTQAPGFPTADEVLDRYARASGRDLSQIDYYVAFGLWKLACIIEGVYSRYKGGAMGNADSDAFDFFGEQVVQLAGAARSAIDRMG